MGEERVISMAPRGSKWSSAEKGWPGPADCAVARAMRSYHV